MVSGDKELVYRVGIHVTDAGIHWKDGGKGCYRKKKILAALVFFGP
jgi:hypothetical protein